jgi:hypothetical protein
LHAFGRGAAIDDWTRRLNGGSADDLSHTGGHDCQTFHSFWTHSAQAGWALSLHLLHGIQSAPFCTDGSQTAPFEHFRMGEFVKFQAALSCGRSLPRNPRELLAQARIIPIAVGYAALLVLSNIVMALLPLTTQDAIADAASTNISHLAVDPFFVLPASAFVDTSNSWLWMPLSLILIGGLERRFGSRRTFLVLLSAHAVATLISEGVLFLQVARQLAPKSAINIVDVGPSYVILAAMAGCLAVGSRSLRITAFIVGVLIVPDLLVDLPELDMAAIGHLFALLLGATLALSCTRMAGWARFTRREAAKVATSAGTMAAEVATPVISAVAPKSSRVSS